MYGCCGFADWLLGQAVPLDSVEVQAQGAALATNHHPVD
jgi:hypothetical protein